MKNINRVILLVMLMALCVLLSACEDKGSQSTGNTGESGTDNSNRTYIFYSEITNEDWKTIDFINKNSDYYFTLMEKMDENKCIQYMDVGNLYGESSEGGEVDRQGIKIYSEEAIFRYIHIQRSKRFD